MWQNKFYCTGILHDLLRCFAFHFAGDVLNVVSSPFLIRLNKLVEVALVPNGEALFEEWRNDTEVSMAGLAIKFNAT